MLGQAEHGPTSPSIRRPRSLSADQGAAIDPIAIFSAAKDAERIAEDILGVER